MKPHPPLPDSLRVRWLNFTPPPRPWNKIRVVKTLFPQLHQQLLGIRKTPLPVPIRQMALFK